MSSFKRKSKRVKKHSRKKRRKPFNSGVNHKPEIICNRIDNLMKSSLASEESNCHEESTALSQDSKVEISHPQTTSAGILSNAIVIPQERAEVPPPEFDIFKDEYNLGELLDLKITEIPFLLEKVIPCNSLVILAGHSDVGKSTLYTQLAMDIIKGKSEFLGLKLNAIHQRVLIVSTEDGPIPFAHRVLKQTINEPIGAKEKSNCKVYFNLDRIEFRIEKYIQNNPVDLVIIDAFGDVFTGEINASNVVRQFFNRYIKIIQQYKCSILFVHHICKGDQKKKQQDKDQLLGSTSIAGKVRNVIMLSNKDDQPKLEIVKGNYLSKEDKKRAYYLNFDTNTLTFSVNNEQVSPSKVVSQTGTPGSDYRSENKQIGRKRNDAQYEAAIEFYKQGMPQKEIAKRLNRDKSTISRWIKRYKSTLGYNTQDISPLP